MLSRGISSSEQHGGDIFVDEPGVLPVQIEYESPPVPFYVAKRQGIDIKISGISTGLPMLSIMRSR